MTSGLATAVVVAVILTLLLPVAGRRPTSFQVRWLGFATILLAPVLPPESATALVGMAVLALVLPRYWYALGAWLFAALVVAFGLYAAYLVNATLLLGGTPLSLLLGISLLALQLGAMGLIVGSVFEMVDALCAPAVDPSRPPDPARWPVVCLQVPTYNEPPELVIETIRSLVALDYPALRVQVIDNNTTDDVLWQPVEAECARLRDAGHLVEFAHLPSWPGYKGGALNWGLAHLADDVEIVGVIDADYVVAGDWLIDAVPHFEDPTVAFVQTPQDYRSWEDSAFYRACYIGFAYFFKVGMVSRARRDAIIFAGTMGLIRRSALEAVGGWDEQIITEDAEVSIRLLERGYRPVYIPRAYGRGIMPLTYEGLRKQRFRWAFGGIQILRRHWRTLLSRRSRLTVGQRYDHLMGGLWWFNDALTFGFALFVGSAAVAAIAGRPFMLQRLSALGLVLPVLFIVLNLVRYLWALSTATRAGPALALAALRVNTSLSWVVALACARALRQERGVFLRTPKFSGRAAIREVRLVWVETVLGLAAFVLLIGVVLTSGFSLAGATLAVLLAWTAIIYASAASYALGDPTRAPIGAGLAQKARLEVAPRVGRAARSRPARLGVAVTLGLIALVVGTIAESSRPPVGELPFGTVPQGPVARAPSAPPEVLPSPSPSAAGADDPTPAPATTSGADSGDDGSIAPRSTPSAPRSTPQPTPAPQVTTPEPTPQPTPGPSAVPTTPTAPRPTAPPTSPPVPRPTVRPTPTAPVPTARPTPPTDPGRTPPPPP